MLDGAPVARIGPNALIQTDQVLTERLGDADAAQIFAAADLPRGDPGGMVPETHVRALFDAMAAARPADWPALADEAGERTAEYLLANRIPAPARLVLRVLPAPLAARLLARAIQRHAWTFAGSGQFHATPDGRCLTITDNPIALPGCPWHRAVFQTLYRRLVSRQVRVEHRTCTALGASACQFDLSFEGP